MYDGRSASAIQERVGESDKVRAASDLVAVAAYAPRWQLADILTVIRYVNKTDVATLANTFGVRPLAPPAIPAHSR